MTILGFRKILTGNTEWAVNMAEQVFSIANAVRNGSRRGILNRSMSKSIDKEDIYTLKDEVSQYAWYC